MTRGRALAVLFAFGLLAQTQDQADFFEKKIRPVLSRECYQCHSAASKPVRGGLFIDSRNGLLRGGSSGRPAVMPKVPEEGLLLAAIKQIGALKMPPGKRLPDSVIADFE